MSDDEVFERVNRTAADGAVALSLADAKLASACDRASDSMRLFAVALEITDLEHYFETGRSLLTEDQ